MLWFDVGNERYTTSADMVQLVVWLWFDVGNERYTTEPSIKLFRHSLWFDVGNERYTTLQKRRNEDSGCGLM